MKVLLKITISTITFCFLSVVLNIIVTKTIQAQCIGCFSSVETGDARCVARLIERDGNTSCTCAIGCSCSGVCEYTAPQTQFEEANLLLNLNKDLLDIPEFGLLVKLNDGETSMIKKVFNQSGYLSDKKLNNVFLNEKYAIHFIDDSTVEIYNVKNGKVDFYNCSNEKIAVINLNKST